MIIGILHKGSGIGDQLFSYIATRVRAADLGVDFGFVGEEFFKGAIFMNLDWGKAHELNFGLNESTGEVVPTMPPKLYKEANWKRWDAITPYYDPEFNFITDRTIINGYGAQDIRYFEHRLEDLKKWFRVSVQQQSPNMCIINFRGGEYQTVPELFLPKEYWDTAIELAKKINPSMVFEVHTDDYKTAREFFPDYNIVSGIWNNWGVVRVAKYAIISNSAFAIIPRLLAHLDNPDAITIAPKFWAGRNVGEWRRPGNYYRQFQYI